MRYLALSILAATFASLCVPAFSSDAPVRYTEAGTHLTTKECLAMQAAKNDGSSRAEMKNACKWTTDANASNNMSSSEMPRAVDSVPYGLPPGIVNPPTQ